MNSHLAHPPRRVVETGETAGTDRPAFRGAAWISETTLDVLRAIGVEKGELEVSELYLETLAQQAGSGELAPLACLDDPGFGGKELLSVTVAAVLAAAQELREAGMLTRPALEQVLDETIARVGSWRALQRRPALLRSIVDALGLARPAG